MNSNRGVPMTRTDDEFSTGEREEKITDRDLFMGLLLLLFLLPFWLFYMNCTLEVEDYHGSDASELARSLHILSTHEHFECGILVLNDGTELPGDTVIKGDEMWIAIVLSNTDGIGRDFYVPDGNVRYAVVDDTACRSNPLRNLELYPKSNPFLPDTALP